MAAPIEQIHGRRGGRRMRWLAAQFKQDGVAAGGDAFVAARAVDQEIPLRLGEGRANPIAAGPWRRVARQVGLDLGYLVGAEAKKITAIHVTIFCAPGGRRGFFRPWRGGAEPG